MATGPPETASGRRQCRQCCEHSCGWGGKAPVGLSSRDEDIWVPTVWHALIQPQKGHVYVLTESCQCTGPLHTAPSFSGGTIQTGLTMDATELQRARSGLAGSSSGQLQGDLPPAKLQRHGSATHASSIEQVSLLPMQCLQSIHADTPA